VPRQNCVTCLPKLLLPPAYRRVIRYYMDGGTAAEVSEALGVPVGTIKARLARARAKLGELIRRELDLGLATAPVNKTRVAQQLA